MTDQTGPQEPADQPQLEPQGQSPTGQPFTPPSEPYQPYQPYQAQQAYWPPQGSTPWPSQGAWQGSPPPSQTARPSRARAVLIGAIVATAAAIISGAAGYEIGTHHSRISSAVQNFKAAAAGSCTSQTEPDPSAISPAGAALLARSLPVPTGEKQGTGQAVTRVLSLHEYVSLLYTDDPAEQARLTALCFQTAVHREFISPGGTITSIWLVQFRTSADARAYTLSTEQGDKSDPANTDVFQVSHVQDGMGLGRPKLDSYGNTLTRLLGDAGNTSMVIHIYLPARIDNAAAAAVLQQQNTRLTVSS